MTAEETIAAAARGEGCLGRSEPDEPVFVLTARDRAAADTVRDWANRAAAMGAPTAKVAEAMGAANVMEVWRLARGGGKVPD